MAIIKYTRSGGAKPNYITSSGDYFYNPNDRTFVGIGSGGGTEMTQAELITYAYNNQYASVLAPSIRHNSTPAAYDPDATESPVVIETLAHVTTRVNAWCSERGI